MKETKETSKLKKVIPGIANKVGRKTIEVACVWWFHQPNVTEEMKQKLQVKK